jgi:hypothetical protein
VFQVRDLAGSGESPKPQLCAHPVSRSQPALPYQTSWHGFTIQPLCVCVCVCVCVFLCVCYDCPSVYLSVCISPCLPLCVCLSPHPTLSPFLLLHVSFSVTLSVCQCVSLCVPLCLSISPSPHPLSILIQRPLPFFFLLTLICIKL